MSDTLVLGAVAYDAKVVPIWDGFKQFVATAKVTVIMRMITKTITPGFVACHLGDNGFR